LVRPRADARARRDRALGRGQAPPWIDWIHTASDQGALVRDYTKWDNQPASGARGVRSDPARRSDRQHRAARPTYINLDAGLQESKVGALPPLPDPKRYRPAEPVQPAASALEAAAKLLSGAKHPVILAGRVSRSEAAWKERVALAEKLQARVFTDIKLGAAFPTDHPLHAAPPATFLPPDAAKLLREADVVLSLDWVDLAGVLKQAWGPEPVGTKVIQVSPDAHSHRGWSMDYQGLPPVDVYMMCEPDTVVSLLLGAVKSRPAAVASKPPALPSASSDMVTIRTLADALNAATKSLDVCMTRLPLGWYGGYRHFHHPLDYIGSEGGGGVGAGPGITVGAALALKGSGRLPVAIMGDGDFLMGNTALWTATHYGIPCLIFVANNRSFFNDELHQERVAKERSRPVENRWIGQRISGPDIDLAMMARSQGAEGIGPVTKVAELGPAIEKGIQAVRNGSVCVVDVRSRRATTPTWLARARARSADKTEGLCFCASSSLRRWAHCSPFSAGEAPAQQWPSRPIRFTVPLPPGGANDLLARVFAERLQPVLGQPVVVENKPGAGGNVGTEFVGKAGADGYSLLLSSNTHVINVYFFSKLPYDPIKDFEPVTLVATIPFVLTVNSSLPVNDMKEMIAYLRSHPGSTYGTAGNRHAAPSGGRAAQNHDGVEITHVPTKERPSSCRPC